MTLGSRDKRALLLLGAAVILALAIRLWPEEGSGAEVVAGQSTVELSEKRLALLRQVAATVPGKQAALDGVDARLREKEKRIIQAETAAQAQAQVLQIVRKVAGNQEPPLRIGQGDLGRVLPLGGDYGEVQVAVSFVCRIEQLLNLLADLANQPEMIATRDMQVRAGDAKQKTVAVRLTVSAVLPKSLVPERKGGMPF